MTKKELIFLLEKFFENKPQDFPILKITNASLKYIGDYDSYLRDDLIYSYLDKVISEILISDQETLKVLKQLVDNLKSSEKFKCSFSLLGIAACLKRHNEKSFINREFLNEIFNKIIDYYNDDIDVQGYDNKKGWLHQAAHGADVLKQFARLEDLHMDMAIKILEAIKEKTSLGYYGYIHSEDERMARVVEVIINRNIIENEFLINWFHSFSLGNETNEKKLVRKGNIRNLLRAIYFKIENEELAKALYKIILTYS